MLKVLIVDDEPKVRRGLSRMVEKNPDKYRLVGSCSTAGEAIDRLAETITDVIITDIRMPGMSGLELIEYLRNHHPHVQFIILSGYGEFEYAREAIRFQVVTYLLKPLNEADLYASLDAAEQNLIREQARQRNYENSYFYILIQSDSPREQADCLKRMGLHLEEHPYYVAVIDIAYIRADVIDDWDALRGVVQEILAAEIGQDVHVYRFFRKQLAAVVHSGSLPDPDRLNRTATALLERLNCQCHIGVSCLEEGEDRLKTLYFQAVTASKYYFYEEYSPAFYYDEKKMNAPLPEPKKLFDRFSAAVKNGDKAVLSRQAAEIVTYYRERRANIFLLQKQQRQLLARLGSLADFHGLDGGELKNVQDLVSEIEGIQHLSQLETALLEAAVRLSDRIQQVIMAKAKAKLGAILDYMQQNYDKNLSLTEVADHVGISPAYLSNYFKNETGTNFVDYLTGLRIQAAKKLLAETNEKVFRVAEKLGYTDAKYFTTLFKNQVGATPLEYRQLFRK